MNQITYKQACELLDVSIDTIKHAVKDGKLTRCADNLKRAVLLQEQVELFKGKRISERSLSLEERELWKQYKRIAESSLPLEEFSNASKASLTLDKIIAAEVEKVANKHMEPFFQGLGTVIAEFVTNYDQSIAHENFH